VLAAIETRHTSRTMDDDEEKIVCETVSDRDQIRADFLLDGGGCYS